MKSGPEYLSSSGKWEDTHNLVPERNSKRLNNGKRNLDDQLTRSSTATFRTFHKNSKIPMMSDIMHPNASTTNTPPTLSIPSSAALSEAAAASVRQRPV